MGKASSRKKLRRIERNAILDQYLTQLPTLRTANSGPGTKSHYVVDLPDGTVWLCGSSPTVNGPEPTVGDPTCRHCLKRGTTKPTLFAAFATAGFNLRTTRRRRRP